jgi:hypothetical protein
MESSEMEKLLTLAKNSDKKKTFLSDLPDETLKDAYKMLYEISEEFIALDEE